MKDTMQNIRKRNKAETGGNARHARGRAVRLMMAAQKGKPHMMETWRVRGCFSTPNGDLTHWRYVLGQLIKDGGIRYIIHRRTDGGKGWSVSEYITGLLVTHIDRKSDAKQRVHDMHDTVAQIVQRMWDDEAHGMRRHEPIFTEVANGMSDDEYQALLSGTFGKVAQ